MIQMADCDVLVKKLRKQTAIMMNLAVEQKMGEHNCHAHGNKFVCESLDDIQAGIDRTEERIDDIIDDIELAGCW